MDYKESLDFLFASLPMYQRLGAAAYKNNLDTSLELDRIHGHPHRDFPCIHIAGTNGKGSVSHMLASVLSEAGLRTGLYTSPHLKDFRERVRVNGRMIPEEEIIHYLENNRKHIEELKPSFFEMTVDLAFLYFQKEKVDIAVIETGMGGRLDSTNIITPQVSVITNIGLDHTRFLGETLQEIAREKAGIIKPEIPVVIGEYQDETYPLFSEIARQKKAAIHVSDKNFRVEYALMNADRSMKLKIRDLLQGNEMEITTDLAGSYQQKNILPVLETITILRETGFDIDDKALMNGLAGVRQKTGLRGRWEEISFNPLIICDTAHNAEGITEVMKQLQTVPAKNLHIIWGMVSDKNPQKILKLLPSHARYYFTKADIPRSMSERILYEMATEFGLKGKSFPESFLALSAAKENAQPEDVIFIGGSTFLVGELI
jgi:dihydrofolate synthase/folylpolyglutamate synthase